MPASMTLEQQSTLKQVAEAAGRQGAELALKKVALDKDALQRVLERGDELKSAVVDVVIAKLRELSADPSVDERFAFVKSFWLDVPKNYVHETQLTSLTNEYRNGLYYMNDALTDKNFAKTSHRFRPGTRVLVKVFNITRRVTSDDCLTFLRANHAVFVGAQGASLVAQAAREELPKGRWYASFDEKEALWKDAGGYHRVPLLYRYSDGDLRFFLGHFERDWDDGHGLLCFGDESSDT